jgi:uncharacterized membrane protein YuzA (DUF378 family)
MDRTALILVIIGAIVWGLVGIFDWNPVAYIFGGAMSGLSRVVYTLVGIGGIWCVKLLFRERELVLSKHHD